jgi:tetratricopeptide (TPR) repeat protein
LSRTTANRPNHTNLRATATRTGRPARRDRRSLPFLILVPALLLAAGAWWTLARRDTATVGQSASIAAATDATEVRLRQEAAQAPRDPRPCRELGDHFLRSGRPFSALWEYQEALARQPGAADARLGLARAAADAGYLALAETTLQSMLSDASPASPGQQAANRLEAARALAAVRLRQSEPAELLAELKPLRAQHPELDRELARAYRVRGDFPAAVAAYTRLRAADATDREALLGLAQTYLEWGRPEGAIRVLSAANDQGMLDGSGWLLLGRALAGRNLDQAAVCVTKAIALRPKDPDVYLEAGRLFERKGDPTSAADQFAQAVRLAPSMPEARLALARALRQLGLTRRARHELAAYYRLRRQPDRVVEALSQDGTSPLEEAETAREAVLALTSLQQSKRAAQLSDQALRAHPEARDLLYQAMLVQLQAGSRERLETMCREVERKFPQSGEPEWFRGRLALAEARTADAVRHFEAAVAKEPKRASFHAALGDALARVPTAENLKHAIPALETALSLDPDAAGARRQLAELLLRAPTPNQPSESRAPGTGHRALSHLLLALEDDPSMVAALNQLVQLAGSQKRPGHAALLSELARSQEARTRALEPLRRAVRDRPADRAARVALARALAAEGRPAEARDQWERAAEGDAPAEVKTAFAASERLLAVLRD